MTDENKSNSTGVVTKEKLKLKTKVYSYFIK